MTNSKVRNSDSAYSICFSQVLLKLFTSLTQIKRYTKFSIVFYSPIILYKLNCCVCVCVFVCPVCIK